MIDGEKVENMLVDDIILQWGSNHSEYNSSKDIILLNAMIYRAIRRIERRLCNGQLPIE